MSNSGEKARDMTASLVYDTVWNMNTAKIGEKNSNVIVINHVLLKQAINLHYNCMSINLSAQLV